jgi:CHASE2 domain-containing sensor protein
MRALLPYLALYKRHIWLLTLGVVLAIVTLLASIGLLTLSGWFYPLLPSLASPVFTVSTICCRQPAFAGGDYPYRRSLFRTSGQP